MDSQPEARQDESGEEERDRNRTGATAFRSTFPVSVVNSDEEAEVTACRLRREETDTPEAEARLEGSTRGWRRWRARLLFVPFLTLGVAVATTAGEGLEPYGPALVAACLTLAVFAVPLSFAVFQLAPYRALLSGASPRHLRAALTTLTVALLPLAGLPLGVAAQIAVVIIPLLALGAFILLQLAQREASAEGLLARADDEEVRRHCQTLVAPIRAQLAETEALEIPQGRGDVRVPPPTHEIFHRVLAPPGRGDPLELLAALAATAYDRGDTYTYSLATRRALAVVGTVHDLQLPSTHGQVDYKVRAALVELALGTVRRIGALWEGEESTLVFGERFVDDCLSLVRGASLVGDQGGERVRSIWRPRCSWRASSSRVVPPRRSSQCYSSPGEPRSRVSYPSRGTTRPAASGSAPITGSPGAGKPRRRGGGNRVSLPLPRYALLDGLRRRAGRRRGDRPWLPASLGAAWTRGAGRWP